ncbi:MAG: redoxin domain-containing protein [Gammaproteobacteria bacterium]|nr:redoxin domain-containing protein [Gammaproteobacteria bacterium]MYF53016.1 redoxin domain-containing protein [Gammaproteobacteria bacterium]MYK44313.1 redoxin domain-containing protein [Gammaproteobacteria bacterium]
MLLRSTNKYCITLAVVMFLLPLFAESDEQKDQWGPEIGSEVPSVDLEDAQGKKRTIKDLRGEKEWLLLFFCFGEPYDSQLLANLQEKIEEFHEAGIAVAVVFDQTFYESSEHKSLENLKFSLLSDNEFEARKNFGLYKRKQKEDGSWKRVFSPIVLMIDSENKVAFKQELLLLLVHADGFDGTYETDHDYEPSLEEILKSLLRLTNKSKPDKETVIEAE